jgi:hypothetical protein
MQAYLLSLTVLCAKRGLITSGCVYLSFVMFTFAGLAELQWVITETIDPSTDDSEVRLY